MCCKNSTKYLARMRRSHHGDRWQLNRVYSIHVSNNLIYKEYLRLLCIQRVSRLCVKDHQVYLEAWYSTHDTTYDFPDSAVIGIWRNCRATWFHVWMHQSLRLPDAISRSSFVDAFYLNMYYKSIYFCTHEWTRKLTKMLSKEIQKTTSILKYILPI